MSGNAYSLDHSCSWVVQSLAVDPSVSFVAEANSFINGGGPTVVHVNIGAAGANVGDLLVAAALLPAAGSRTVSAPAGWTLLRTDEGLGTLKPKMTCWWKTAVSGDLSATVDFTLSSSSDAAAMIIAYSAVSASVIAAAAAVSAADGSTATGPTVPTYDKFTVDFLGIERASGGPPPPIALGVTPIANAVTARGGQGVGGVQLTGYDYLAPPAPDQWHLGSVAAGIYWS